ncbi:MAG: hypothetical protein WBG46_01790 [Nonlabens sp.]
MSRSNTKNIIWSILGFKASVLIAFLGLHQWGVLFAMSVPALIFVFVGVKFALSRKRY